LSIPATVTISFGATYHFHLLQPPFRVTILLAQIAMLLFCGVLANNLENPLLDGILLRYCRQPAIFEAMRKL
jgi:hypothetical protein